MGKLWTAYKMRVKRRRLLYRALRKRHQMENVVNRTVQIGRDDILLFSTVRNELIRLPYFLDYYRKLGVKHFLFVDNNSEDGTTGYLQRQPDVSLWSTRHSYKLSRFGVDWLTWLQIRYGHGHWCLTVDADEILVYPYCDERPLVALTEWMDSVSVPAFGALMLDMYPKGPLDSEIYRPGNDPFEILRWFDAGNYRIQMQRALQNQWVQGGVRERVFFASQPERAPTLNKIPLVKWNRRFAYNSSTHSILPPRLNRVFDLSGADMPRGVLLHSKFLHVAAEKAREEKQRQEHFANSRLYDGYYDSLSKSPDLWCRNSVEYEGWQQLEALKLLSKGQWA